jgi:hypothetical protein
VNSDNYFSAERKKEKKLKSKYPALLKQSKSNRKKKRAFTINNIDEIINELNSIASPAIY